MITAEVKSIISTDLQYPSLPDCPDDCSVAIEVTIGPKGMEGGDLFQFTAATIKSLNSNPHVCWGRGYLLMDSFSWSAIQYSLEQLLQHCRKETWEDVARELNKYMLWEFENYSERTPNQAL